MLIWIVINLKGAKGQRVGKWLEKLAKIVTFDGTTFALNIYRQILLREIRIHHDQIHRCQLYAIVVAVVRFLLNLPSLHLTGAQN
jgi:hypothetical protein